MGRRRTTLALTLAALAACAVVRAQEQAQAQSAQDTRLFTQVEALPASGFWLDSGFATWHFNQNQNLNGGNRGLGAEYRFSTTMAAAAGRFVNSDRAYSDYAGVIWQPYAIGPVAVGAAIAAFNGYPKMRAGGWFPAAIPTLSWAGRRVGLNVGIIPSYKDRLYGGISVQLKLKLF
jgi:hypothetical protein